MRSSKQKESILDVLHGAKHHPTAQSIYEEARKTLPSLSLGTVYRNLRRLCEQGEVDELRYDKYPGRYELHTERHHHVRCVECGRLDDVDCDDLPRIVDAAARRKRYEIIDHHVQILGICPNCQSIRHHTR